jgi:hypothetical protein
MADKSKRSTKREISDEQRERLKRIGAKKGEVRNPKGRPPKDEALKITIEGMTDDIVQRLYQIAMDGNNEASSVKAIETLMSYRYTKAATKHEVDVQVATFGDFLIAANQRHAALAEPVIDAEFVPVTEDTKAVQ